MSGPGHPIVEARIGKPLTSSSSPPPHPYAVPKEKNQESSEVVERELRSQTPRFKPPPQAPTNDLTASVSLSVNRMVGTI